MQRTLSAKNINHAKGGCVMAAALKLLPLFTLVMPGMAARILFKNEVPKIFRLREYYWFNKSLLSRLIKITYIYFRLVVRIPTNAKSFVQ